MRTSKPPQLSWSVRKNSTSRSAPMCYPPSGAPRKSRAYGLSQPTGSQVSLRAVGHRHVNIEEGAAGARNRVRCWRRHRRPLCDAEDVTASTAEIRPARSRPVYRGVSSEKRVILSEKRVRPAPRRLLDGLSAATPY